MWFPQVWTFHLEILTQKDLWAADAICIVGFRGTVLMYDGLFLGYNATRELEMMLYAKRA